MRIWKFPDQVIRLAVIILLAGTALIAVRQRFVPESFGEAGHYRADAIPAIAAQEMHYAGSVACVECHDDVGEIKDASFHKNVACETCHEAAAAHAEDPTEVLPHRPTRRQECLRCHEYVPTRPTGFPQVISPQHNPLEPCSECHDPHDPTPPVIPSTCSACHAGLARTKAVSHHARLDCQTCHEVQDEHRLHPRDYPAKKPTTREFCGSCHAENAEGLAGAPRIDMDEHEPRYVCWQCHYPHYPQGK